MVQPIVASALIFNLWKTAAITKVGGLNCQILWLSP